MNNRRLNTLVSMMIFLLVVSAAYAANGFKITNFTDLGNLIYFIITVTVLMKIAHWVFKIIDNFVGFILSKIM